jgi:hypothetical protein
MCGRKRKFSEVVRNWQGLYRCPEHNEPRQPQDFVRGVADVMTVPFAQPEADKYVTVNARFPATVFPSLLVLTNVGLDIETESTGNVLFTEAGVDLITEPGYLGLAEVLLPSWVWPTPATTDPLQQGIYVTSVLWSWFSGGTNISIDNPTALQTYFQTLSPGSSGVAQCVITNSLGAVATVNLTVHN